MSLRFGSFCSGIAAPEAAWTSLGWRPLFFSEIDQFASAVLTHHHRNVPNLGNMEEIDGQTFDRFQPVDVVVAGTPCQSFSVAGLRGGMADARGNLALVFLRLVDRIRPRWVVWENVPGVLSSGDGRDFGSFLGALGQLGYGWSYRVLDAQHFGVPQRRRRVFVVGYLGDWRRAAAVLFERHCLSGNPAPRRETGAGTAACFTAGAHPGGHNGQDDHKDGRLIPVAFDWYASESQSLPVTDECPPLKTTMQPAIAYQCHGSNAGEIGTFRAGNGNESGGVPFIFAQNQRDEVRIMDVAGALAGEPGMKQQSYVATAFTITGTNKTARTAIETEVAGSLRTKPPGSIENSGTTVAMTGMAVRRLMPVECERLQGFPDGYTNILYRGKPAADGPRYRAIGNSMAVPVLKWIGERIEMVEAATMAESEVA